MPETPRIFDRGLHAHRLDRASALFGAADFLKARAADDLVERLWAINRTFPIAVDLGARDGAFRRALDRFPAERTPYRSPARVAFPLGEDKEARPRLHQEGEATRRRPSGRGSTPPPMTSTEGVKVGWLAETDLSLAMLEGRPGARLVADEERLPFAAESLDLVVSSLALHWVNDLVGAMVQIRRALKPDGLFLGAMLGGATLTELRQCLSEAETRVRGGAGPRVSPFVDAADAAALLQRAGFALPVVDTDTVTARYDHPLRLLADLRAMGETAALVDRPREPFTRRIVEDMAAIYAERFSAPDGKVIATFEIVTLTGWAPHPDQQKPSERGSAKMRLADVLGGALPGAT